MSNSLTAQLRVLEHSAAERARARDREAELSASPKRDRERPLGKPRPPGIGRSELGVGLAHLIRDDTRRLVGGGYVPFAPMDWGSGVGPRTRMGFRNNGLATASLMGGEKGQCRWQEAEMSKKRTAIALVHVGVAIASVIAPSRAGAAGRDRPGAGDSAAGSSSWLRLVT
jgi:hypothetical protein